MFVMTVEKNIATITSSEPITSGSSNVYLVKFDFSPEWEDLSRVAVFKREETIINVLLDDSNICFMPWEVMTKQDVSIRFGVYGTKNGSVVLPTIWASTEVILEGVITGIESHPPTPSIIDQVLGRLQEVEDKCDSINVSASGVSSFNNRTGAVMPEKGDYSVSDISGLSDALDLKLNVKDRVDYTFGNGLSEDLDTHTVSLNIYSTENQDASLPVSYATVKSMLGDIESLLKAI